jgi:hypothetical protein
VRDKFHIVGINFLIGVSILIEGMLNLLVGLSLYLLGSSLSVFASIYLFWVNYGVFGG